MLPKSVSHLLLIKKKKKKGGGGGEWRGRGRGGGGVAGGGKWGKRGRRGSMRTTGVNPSYPPYPQGFESTPNPQEMVWGGDKEVLGGHGEALLWGGEGGRG